MSAETVLRILLRCAKLFVSLAEQELKGKKQS